MYERVHVNVLLNPPGVEWLDRLAAQNGRTADRPLTRSVVIRAALRVARKHEAEVEALLKEQL